MMSRDHVRCDVIIMAERHHLTGSAEAPERRSLGLVPDSACYKIAAITKQGLSVLTTPGCIQN